MIPSTSVEGFRKSQPQTPRPQAKLSRLRRQAAFWFQSYLSGRRQCVTALGATSKDLPVTSGVPQGSIIGPVLFPLCVSGLPDVVSSSRVLMFADDIKIFKEIRALGDASSFQIDLGRLETWSQTSSLAFNEAKCKAQRIRRRTKPIMSTYKLNNTVLETSAAEKDLGVWIILNLPYSILVYKL